ncbi:LOW QUALITY PROTEIN: hypothetical protein HID58_034098 [Brassica napus]|uniref:Uncharacterized protein n=1 Tax=Brassica napus TaxID=3708 RepID=A0ABQ8C221_BRANA|nr:LOW QUALITY PROTEIN: hypothetical protein HID58_034098 [Brassica napus]
MDFQVGLRAGFLDAFSILDAPLGTFSMFVLVPGDNLADSWYRSRSPGHWKHWLNSVIDPWALSTTTAICPSEVSHHQCWDDLASCFHGTQRILGMLSQNLEVRGCDPRLYGLSSRNPEAGWTLVKELVACMDLSPGTLSYPFGSLKDGTRCFRLLNLEYRDASHSTFRFGTLILYFTGRQDLLSGLVTHDLGGMEIFVEVWRLLLLEDHNFFWLLSAPSWTGVFLTPSLGIPVSYNLSRGANLETWRGTDPEFPREFVGGFVIGKSGSKVVRACFFVEPLDFTSM